MLILWAIFRMAAQQITGTVTDKEYGEPMPGVYVHYEDSRKGTVITDVDGRYKIAARRGNLIFTSMGYEERIIPIEKVRSQRVDVVLTQTVNAMREVEIVSKRRKYSRKDNPAVEMMRKVIASKRSSDLRAHDYFSYQKYEKMTFALNNVTDKVFEDERFKRMPFLKEHVELCPETGKNILPLIIEEKVGRQIYRKNPKTEKTIITGERTEGISDLLSTGDLVTGMLSECFEDVDIYQDDVRLFQFPFISPISSGEGAISFYRYFIADTIYVDSDKCYKIDFTPNNSQDFGFSGSLYIMADSTWRVRRSRLNVPPKSDVNFIEHLDIIQDFQSLPSGEQVMTENHMIVQLMLTSWLLKLQVERTTRYDNYDFTPIPDRTFNIKGDTKVESSAHMRDEAFWDEHRPAPLTQGEGRVRLFMHRVQDMKGFKFVIWIAKAFIENYVETSIRPEHPSKVDIGPINTVLGSNFVEGFRLRLSAQTTANLSKHWFLKGYAKYGFGDKRWKGLAELTYSFNAKDYLPREFPVHNLTVSYQNDVMSPCDKFIQADKDNVFFALKWAPVRHMNYFDRFRLLYDREWENGLRMALQIRRERNEGAGQLFYQTLNQGRLYGTDLTWQPDPDGQRIHKIVFTEAVVGLTFQPGATYVNTKQRRLATNNDSPVLGLTHTVGVKGVLGGQYNYNFTEASIYKRFWMRSWGKVNLMARGGVQWNKVPYPLLIMPTANLSYIMDAYSFRLMENMEFLNDRYASLMLSWDMNGKILNRIPLIKKLKWREFIGVNMLWGKLTDKNNPFLTRNIGDSRLMFFPGSYAGDGRFRYVSHAMNPKKPYVEVMVGVHNVFKFFHIEYVHRLTYVRSDTKRWGIRFAFQASF